MGQAWSEVYSIREEDGVPTQERAIERAIMRAKASILCYTGSMVKPEDCAVYVQNVKRDMSGTFDVWHVKVRHIIGV